MKVSVVIPVYRAEPVLARCVKSLLAQTHSDLELIFVDDCSPDASVELIRRLAGDDVRVKVVSLDANRGRVGARLAGVARASGEYVGFVDADDWVEPDCYAKLLAVAVREDADAVVCGYCDVAADGTASSPHRVSSCCVDPQEFVAQSFYSPGFNSLCNKIFRRELALEWLSDELPNLCVGEDLAMTMRFLSRARRLAFVDEPLYSYRKTEISISREISRRTVSDMVTCVRWLATEFPALPPMRLDIMRCHVLWSVLRCTGLSADECRSLAGELEADFLSCPSVPLVKRIVLPFAVRHVVAGRFIIRGIEFVRKVLS